MNLGSLAWRLLWARPLVAALNLALLALGTGAMTMLLTVGAQVERSLQRDLAGIDLVVGAKGSPLQLILAGVFHLDVPTGNVPLQTEQMLRQHPLVARVVPVALGDSLRGYRIVGTSPDYLDLYGARVAEGRRWSAPLEAVLGERVAAELGLGLGARFVGSHGLGRDGEAHEATPYTVVGRLARCDCVIDRLVLTGVESVWAVHEQAQAQDEDDLRVLREEREVTLLLVSYRSPIAAATLPRWVNAQDALQAAAPAVESARLFRLIGVGMDVLRGFAALLLGVGGVSVFVALLHAVRDREPDLAMMRMLGAPPRRLAWLVCAEAMWLALLGLMLGLALGHGLTHLLGLMLARDRSLALYGLYWTPEELWCIVGVLGLALASAAWPAWRANRLDVTRLLQSPR
jgi:putative ABC transport system permease protein